MDEYFYDDDRLVNAMIDRVNDLYDTIAPAVFSDPNRPATYEKFLSERQYLLDYLVSRADSIR